MKKPFALGLALALVAGALHFFGASRAAATTIALPLAPVQWATMILATGSAGTLKKSSGCDGCPSSGGVSVQQFTAAGGAVEFTPAWGYRLFAGLTDTTGSLPATASLPFAFSFWSGGTWDVRERGIYRTEGRHAPGDVFRIEVDATTVRYLRNGGVVYTSAAPSGTALKFGVTFYSANASITAAKVAMTVTGSPVVGPPVGTYTTATDRYPRPEPPLPIFGPAGSTIVDPSFGTTIRRITDRATRPGMPGRSFRTPSGTHQHAWSARGTYFYVVSNDGTIIPYVFNAATGAATRIQPVATDAGGLVLKFFNEAQFSYVQDSQIYATYNGSGATLRSIDQYDFSTGLYTRLLDLDTVVPGLAGTLVGGIGSSAGAVERILVFFGGASQDKHYYLTVFNKNNPADRRVLNTLTSTIDGLPTATLLNFKLHHASIDRSGRFVMLYPTSADLAAPRTAAHVYVWDTQANSIVALGQAALSNGHDAPGYGALVNQDCCTQTSWDAAQWQYRRLDTPLAPTDLVRTVLTPKEIYLADHPSWHNARPDVSTPFISALYRYTVSTVPWRAWDDEIVAVQTDPAPGVSATIWRLAHHRSDVSHDNDPTRISFWYTPRPNVSPDGRWVLFTSNWEKSLGPDTAPEPGAGYRQDVFLLRAR